MAVTIKSEREIELMREAGRLLAIVHKEMEEAIRPGISTKEIDTLGESVIRKLGCVPNFKNYHGYPASVCVSVNDEVVHGIPSSIRFLEEGDIVSLDAGLIYKGYHSDAARTHGVGQINPLAQKFAYESKLKLSLLTIPPYPSSPQSIVVRPAAIPSSAALLTPTNMLP